MKSRKYGKLKSVLKVSRLPTYARNVGGGDLRWDQYIRPAPLKSALLDLDIKTIFPQGGDTHSMYGKQNVAGGHGGSERDQKI